MKYDIDNDNSTFFKSQNFTIKAEFNHRVRTHMKNTGPYPLRA